MPDVQEGLTSVDSDADFEAALAAAVGREVPEGREYAPDTSVASGLAAGLASTESQEQPRDGEGRFATSEPAAQPSGEGDAATVPAEGQTVADTPEVDPAITALLEQHGGDASSALAALLTERDNAQSLIGRQGSELGELRQAQARMEGQIEALMAGAAVPAELPSPAADGLVEDLESMYEDRGAQGMMSWVIENRPDLIDTAIEVWEADSPAAASRFAVRYERALADQEAQSPAPQGDPFLEGLRQQAMFTSAVDEARSSLSIGESDWPAIRDQVIPAFEDATTSPLIKNAIVSEDASTRRQGMEALLQIARGRAISTANAEATAQANEAATAEAVARKTAAQVVTGSLRPAERQPGEEQTKEEAIAAFHKSLLATETTSVEEGLRAGKMI